MRPPAEGVPARRQNARSEFGRVADEALARKVTWAGRPARAASSTSSPVTWRRLSCRRPKPYCSPCPCPFRLTAATTLQIRSLSLVRFNFVQNLLREEAPAWGGSFDPPSPQHGAPSSANSWAPQAAHWGVLSMRSDIRSVRRSLEEALRLLHAEWRHTIPGSSSIDCG